MDHLCVRCTRQALRSSHTVRRKTATIPSRPFSLSSTTFAGPIDLSQPLEDVKPSRSTSSSATTPRSSPSKASTSSGVLKRPENVPTPPKVLTSKSNAGSIGTPATLFGRSLNRSGSSPGVLTRSFPERSHDRTNTSVNKDHPAGQVLRRSGPPRGRQGQASRPHGSNYGAPRSANRGPRVDRAMGGRGGGGRSGFAPRGGNTGLTEEESQIADAIRADSSAAAKKAEAARDAYIDETFEQREIQEYNDDLNNGLPTEAIPYVPAEQTMEELRKDWPDTPLSAAGLTEGLVQKLNFLARDLPHGYWTPKQIAERLVEGGLVKFESEEHKEKVMSYAAQIMQEKKDKVASDGEASSEDVAPEAGFVSVAGKAEGTQSVVDAMVKGVYPELEKGQRPLFAGVTRQLRNNETYGTGDANKLVGRIQTLIAGIQKQVAAQKEAAAKEAA